MKAKTKNPFIWVEIYVEDMSRAQKFYETVLEIEMTPLQLPSGFDDLEMKIFPWAEGQMNTNGALCKASEMKPGAGGTIVYFNSEDCAVETARVEKAGGKVLQDKFPIGDYGFCSVVMDTEGNTIGFNSMN